MHSLVKRAVSSSTGPRQDLQNGEEVRELLAHVCTGMWNCFVEGQGRETNCDEPADYAHIACAHTPSLDWERQLRTN